MTTRNIVLIWLVLMIATALTAALPHWSGPVSGVALALITLKNLLIVERFMGLNRAPWFWRGLIHVYTPAVVLITGWLLL